MVTPPIATERLELVPLSLDAMDALIAGRRSEAASIAGVGVPKGWPDNHDAGFLALRARQLRENPARAEWPVYAIALRDAGRTMIGHAGFHGPPGINSLRAEDAVEFGYTVFEPFRSRGYATETVGALLEWARDERGIRHFVLSVAPTNDPSLAIVRRFGFEQTGSQWDEEDGEELVFELRI
jgi:[ribosomal protein S5]-alanine N-acetyltransferase